MQELFRGFVEAGYDALVNSFPARSKKPDAKYLDSIKCLQRRDEKKLKKYRNTINRREKYMEYKASKKANDTDHAIPLCDRRIPSWIATAYLHSDQKHATKYENKFYTPPLPKAAGKIHCASIPLVSQSVPLMAHYPGHILNPAIATPTKSG
jgi:hypothetical protein